MKTGLYFYAFSKDKSYGRDNKRRGIVFYEINVDAIF